jgi:hypothetical protein
MHEDGLDWNATSQGRGDHAASARAHHEVGFRKRAIQPFLDSWQSAGYPGGSQNAARTQYQAEPSPWRF